MADPFDTTNNPNMWNNLMNFGLATMAAGAQPGARTLGAIGQGGMEAMKSARENTLARTQNQLYGAEAQSKLMSNAVQMNQLNMQRMGLGLPPLDIPGQPQQLSAPQPSSSPPSNSSGMPFSSTPGKTTSEAPTNMPSTNTSFDQTRLSAIGSGRAQPSSAEEAAAAAPWANMMGYTDRAKELNTYALAAPIDASKVHEIAPGGAAYQNGQIVATGAQEGVTPEGAKFRVPAQSNGQQPLGVRNNNPGNIRPNGDNWQGSTGQESGYVKFDNPISGIRAASINLQSYMDKGINTPMTIAQNWAPKKDGNDPGGYAFNIAHDLNVKPDQPLDLRDPATNAAVIHAIIKQENGGSPYDSNTIMQGVQSAFNRDKQQPNAFGTPQGAMLTGLPPGTEEFKKGRGTDLSKKMSDIDDRALHAKEGSNLLDQMELSSQSWKMGKFSEVQGDARAYMQSFAKMFTDKETVFDKPVADFQSFQKNAGHLVRQAVREVSSRAAVQEYQMIQKSLPSADMSRGGFMQIKNQMQSMYDYDLAKQQAAQSWLQSHSTPEGFESEFNQKITPAVFLVQRMEPQELQYMRTQMLKQPGGKQALDNLLGKVKNAQEMGLIQ